MGKNELRAPQFANISAILDGAVERGELPANGNNNAWSGWDKVSSAVIDRAFTRVDDMGMDAQTVKILILDALGVEPGNIKEFIASGKIVD